MGSSVERSFDRGAMSRSEEGAAFTRLSLRTRKAQASTAARVTCRCPASGPRAKPRRHSNDPWSRLPTVPRAVHDFRLLPESSPSPGSTKPNQHRLRGRSNTTSHRGPGLIQKSAAHYTVTSPACALDRRSLGLKTRPQGSMFVSLAHRRPRSGENRSWLATTAANHGKSRQRLPCASTSRL